MRTALSVIFYFLFLGLSQAQELKGDLRQAPYIRINQKYTFNKSPAGYGYTQEIKLNPRRSATFFREERNSAWFLIDVPFDGVLTFDIKPHQIIDDYDWMLFFYNASLEKSIKDEVAKPLRSNNARNSKYTSSKTGLGKKGKSSFVKPGPGNNYSMPLAVKKGSKLALVADNIYGGKGFDIEIWINPIVTGPYVVIEGTVKDRYTKDNLAAEVYIEDDSTGTFIAKANTDIATGRYTLKVPVNRPLNISANSVSHAFKTTDSLVKQSSVINFLLDTLYSGFKLSLYNIHFYPNKDDILPSSVAELNRLLTFM
ncbi:MAG: hypothetical protein H7096_11785, partial [Flavobacterium sp.]|nr:hypothetical protein [Pedobacter sp.]